MLAAHARVTGIDVQPWGGDAFESTAASETTARARSVSR